MADLNHVGRLSHFSPVLTGDVLEIFSPPNTPKLGLGLTMTYSTVFVVDPIALCRGRMYYPASGKQTNPGSSIYPALLHYK
jgi:hypothetical protein